jgi:hypothetical protein
MLCATSLRAAPSAEWFLQSDDKLMGGETLTGIPTLQLAKGARMSLLREKNQ